MKAEGLIIAGSEKEAHDGKGSESLEGLIILTEDCLVTVIVQKY